MLIPYPDVPNVAGVPNIPRQSQAPAAFVQPTQTVTPIPTAKEWQITDSNGAALITPDSVIEFEYRGEMKIADYPVEAGSFSSYNKIIVPFDARMTLACGGNGAMTRQVFLGTLEALRLSLVLISIVTPDVTYPNCNLVHVDYRRQSRHGVSLILAQIWFQEVRIVGAATPSTAKPDGAPPKANGQVSPVPATPKATAAVTKTPVMGGATGTWSTGGATGSW